LLDDVAPLVANYYHELAPMSIVGVTYEQSWSGDLERALRASFDDDRYRGHTTIGPQRDDLALTLTDVTRDARRPRANNVRVGPGDTSRRTRISSKPTRVDPLLLLTTSQRTRSTPKRPALKSPPTGQTLVTTASPLPAGNEPGRRHRPDRVAI